jgi:hypothetical protein
MLLGLFENSGIWVNICLRIFSKKMGIKEKGGGLGPDQRSPFPKLSLDHVVLGPLFLWVVETGFLRNNVYLWGW